MKGATPDHGLGITGTFDNDVIIETILLEKGTTNKSDDFLAWGFKGEQIAHFCFYSDFNETYQECPLPTDKRGTDLIFPNRPKATMLEETGDIQALGQFGGGNGIRFEGVSDAPEP